MAPEKSNTPRKSSRGEERIDGGAVMNFKVKKISDAQEITDLQSEFLDRP